MHNGRYIGEAQTEVFLGAAGFATFGLRSIQRPGHSSQLCIPSFKSIPEVCFLASAGFESGLDQGQVTTEGGEVRIAFCQITFGESFGLGGCVQLREFIPKIRECPRVIVFECNVFCFPSAGLPFETSKVSAEKKEVEQPLEGHATDQACEHLEPVIHGTRRALIAFRDQVRSAS